MFAGASVRPVVPVVVALVAGPGVTSPKNRLSGCETVTLASSRSFVSSRALDRSAAETIRVSQQLSVDGVADVSLQRPQRFAFGLPFGDLAVEVDATLALGVADLSDGGHVDRGVQDAVSRAATAGARCGRQRRTRPAPYTPRDGGSDTSSPNGRRVVPVIGCGDPGDQRWAPVRPAGLVAVTRSP